MCAFVYVFVCVCAILNMYMCVCVHNLKPMGAPFQLRLWQMSKPTHLKTEQNNYAHLYRRLRVASEARLNIFDLCRQLSYIDIIIIRYIKSVGNVFFYSICRVFLTCALKARGFLLLLLCRVSFLYIKQAACRDSLNDLNIPKRMLA